MLIPLGVLAASGAGPVGGDYELISTTVLPSNAANVTFDVSTFASTYKHLQIRIVAGHTNEGAGNAVVIRLNGDTGSNYVFHELGGGGSSVYSVANTSQTFGLAVALRQPLSNTVFGAGVVDILDAYSTTKNKTIRTLTGVASSPNSIILLGSGLRVSTEAVSSITLLPSAGNLSTGSRFSLYGIKG
jgi:hypothetical protein